MAQDELLSLIVRTLEALGIDCMLTGSHASSLQGEARATHDIDLVVDRMGVTDLWQRVLDEGEPFNPAADEA